jgi:hypothetical protein
MTGCVLGWDPFHVDLERQTTAWHYAWFLQVEEQWVLTKHNQLGLWAAWPFRMSNGSKKTKWQMVNPFFEVADGNCCAVNQSESTQIYFELSVWTCRIQAKPNQSIYVTTSSICFQPISNLRVHRPLRGCSFCSQSMWIRWDWVGLNPKQVKIFHHFFPIPSNPRAIVITEPQVTRWN